MYRRVGINNPPVGGFIWCGRRVVVVGSAVEDLVERGRWRGVRILHNVHKLDHVVIHDLGVIQILSTGLLDASAGLVDAFLQLGLLF